MTSVTSCSDKPLLEETKETSTTSSLVSTATPTSPERPSDLLENDLEEQSLGRDLITTPTGNLRNSNSSSDIPLLLDNEDSAAGGFGEASTFTSLVVLLKILVAGFFVVSSGFKLAGIVAGPVIFVGIAMIELYGMMLLIQCRRAVPKDVFVRYDEVAALSRWPVVLPRLVSVFILLSEFGFIVLDFLCAATSWTLAIQTFWKECEIVYVLTFILVLLIPLAWVRRLEYFSILSFVGTTCIISSIVYCLYFVSTHEMKHTPEPIPWVGEPVDIIKFFGSAVYYFEGINLILPIYDAHKNKSQFPCLLACVIIGLTIGFCGFSLIWCLLFGEDTANLIVQNLPEGSFANLIVQVAYGIGMFSSAPVLFFLIPGYYEHLSFFVNLGERGSVRRKMVKNLFRSFIVALAFLMAWLGGDQIATVIAICGSFCCAPLTLVFPAVMHLTIINPKQWWLKGIDGFMIIFGLFIFIVSTVCAFTG